MAGEVVRPERCEHCGARIDPRHLADFVARRPAGVAWQFVFRCHSCEQGRTVVIDDAVTVEVAS